MKKRIRLVTVLKIKKHLEEIIEELYSDIIKYNNTDTQISSLLDRIIKANEQLIVIKEAVQKANQGRHKTGHTNNYYIYKYSNLKTLKSFYTRLRKQATSTSQINPDYALNEIRKVNVEMETISTKLSNFNLRKSVVVVLDDSLDLLKLLE